MHVSIRIIILYLTSGPVWCICMRLLFITSGAQQVLASPAYQSSKFLRVFMEYPPLPRMAADALLVWKGFFVCGLLAAGVFTVMSKHIKGSWLRVGSTFGLIHWSLMIPWFEFYLPYNVMHEPLPLVLLECFLWLVTLQLLGIYMSLVMNFRKTAP